MAGLLVSVRSVAEAKAAWLGGAAVIDIKEPSHGPLGRASVDLWRAVREEVPPELPVSVALGELIDLDPESIHPADLAGITFQKAGPSGLSSTWPARWDEVCRRLPRSIGLVAVAYADWSLADAPDPDRVIASALLTANCPGLLVDTWDKRQACPIVVDQAWRSRIKRVQATGRFVALAGRLDLETIERLGPLRPDLFAVRGAACRGGDRQTGTVDRELVARLVELARSDHPLRSAES